MSEQSKVSVPEGAVEARAPSSEAEAFAAWASRNHYDMEMHPLHWLFLNRETNIAWQGWKAAIAFAAPNPAQAVGAQVGVPDGWRLVPIKATDAQLQVGRRAIETAPDYALYIEEAGWVYDAMLAAAPKHAAEGVKPDEAVVMDAMRYRWLRDLPLGSEHEQITNFPGDMWDRLTDEAMAKESTPCA